MKKLFIFNSLLLLSVVIFFSACKKDKDKGDLSSLTIYEMDDIIDPAEVVEDSVGSSSDQLDGQGTVLNCVTRTMKWAPGRSETLLLNPLASIIYPGSILRASSITDGSYRPILGDRTSVRVYTTLQNVQNAYVDVDEPTGASIQQAINDLQNQQLNGSIPANASFDSEEVFSSTDLSLWLGAGFNYSGVNITADLGFDFSTSKRRYVAKFVQKYYDVIVDPKRMEDYWNELPPMSEFEGDVPGIVSRVTYGRVILLAMEFDSDSLNASADISAMWSESQGLSSENTLNVINKSSSVKLFVSGGTTAGVTINSAQDLEEEIDRGKNYGPNSRGEVISYQLNNISDGSLITVVSTGEFDVRECEVISLSDNEIPLDLPVISAASANLYAIHTDGNDYFNDNNEVHVSGSIVLEVNDDSTAVIMDLNVNFTSPDEGTEGAINREYIIPVDPSYKISQIASQNFSFFDPDLSQGASNNHISHTGTTEFFRDYGESGGIVSTIQGRSNGNANDFTGDFGYSSSDIWLNFNFNPIELIVIPR